MKKHSTKSLRHSFAEPDVPEGPLGDLLQEDTLNLNASRRSFLKVFGFSVASAAVLAACKKPVRKAIPYAVQPPEIIPRKPLFYASTYFDGHDYCSILVKTIDGRPIKIEGNSLSEFNGEATTARIQASILGLYDDARPKYPGINGKQAEWAAVDGEIIKQLADLNNSGGQIVLLTSTINSPSTIRLINEFGASLRNFRWIQYDPVSYSAVKEANNLTFGKAVFPDYNFRNTDLVVSVNCDFIGTWGVPVHFIPGYVNRRKPDTGNNKMLYHIQYESGLTLTGSNADKRIKIRPSEEKTLLADLYNKIAGKTGGQTFNIPSFREDLTSLADMLIAAKGRSIVISGTNSTEIQIIVNAINTLLGSYERCIDLVNPVNIAAGDDRQTESLINDLYEGKISGLIMHNVNPAYDFPDPVKFTEALGKLQFSANLSASLNETSGKSIYECPVNHFLESWNDAEIKPGQLSLAQPCISPLFNTRSFQDSLLKWSGKNVSWHDYLTSVWEKEYLPVSGYPDFRAFWNKSLSTGIYNYKTESEASPSMNSEALIKAMADHSDDAAKGYEIVLSESIALGAGMNSNNPWLMELPDPVTRHCWENVALISPSDAAGLGIVNGQVINIDSISLPALIQPGQAEGTISIALGYGHDNTGQVASGIGVNVFPFAGFRNGNRLYGFRTDKIAVTPEIKTIALVQLHNSQEGRPLARQTTLKRYRQDPVSGNEHHVEFETMHKSLYPDTPFDGFHWAIAIDLNACIGCNTCVIACQVENNSPTVGKAEVIRNRIMHWIKVHRYYSDDLNEPRVIFQPVFCQHCDDAPCENVCPVSATNHNNEGLNQMAYNRCVGTKYCMNNCPYRVRRFNWFRYTNNKAFDYNTASDLGKMVLNPDVTVRERGVVEKCSFCVQRIQAKKLEAKLEGRTLKDMEIKTACMQACPAGAIIFGDLNDPESRVSQLFKDPRRYGLLEELHTLPSVGFLTKVWNDEGEKA
ncbi:MAG TPA: 4Fe-4S dicluster domain-containing protein [Bacteroidales bacterium]|nr:4Fe-4S dicluster domain-containing protein [Bacteroidales bacterium]